jgi:hypothetical protein
MPIPEPLVERYTLEQFHQSGCPAVADDESDYEHLAAHGARAGDRAGEGGARLAID